MVLGLFDKTYHFSPIEHNCMGCKIHLHHTNVDPMIDSNCRKNLMAIHCQSAGIPMSDGQPEIRIPNRMIESVDALGLPEKFVVLHCTSCEAERNWSAEKWRTLSSLITKKIGLSVVEVGSRPILDFDPSFRTIDLCSRISMLESAEVIRRAALFVGIDSGPAHMANAVGTQGVLLLSRRHQDYPAVYMPFSGGFGDGSRATIVRADKMSDISVDDVLAAITKRLTQGGRLPPPLAQQQGMGY